MDYSPAIMPKITSVQRQKSSKGRSASGRKPQRFNIFLDGQFAFGADEDLVVNFRLLPGKILQTEDLDNLLFESQVGKLMDKMYNLFSIRQRSGKEVRDYFRIKNHELKVKEKEEISDLVIESLIQKLITKGLINDAEFAKSWVQSRRKSKLKGMQAIKMELIQKGIDRDIIEEVLSLSPEDVGEEVLAGQALEKKLRVWHSLPELEFKKKAYGYLARKGFGFSTISTVVAKYLKKG